MIEVAETIYRLTEAMNELPLAAKDGRQAIEEAIVSLCKQLNGTTQTRTQDN